jgi:hypothetical protein
VSSGEFMLDFFFTIMVFALFVLFLPLLHLVFKNVNGKETFVVNVENKTRRMGERERTEG